MNPLSVYLDGTERYSWRDTLKIFAISIFVVAAIHLLILMKVYFCVSHGESYKNGEVAEVQTGSPDTGSPWWPRKWISWGSLMWLLGIFGVSSAIFIPKTMFVSVFNISTIPLISTA